MITNVFFEYLTKTRALLYSKDFLNDNNNIIVISLKLGKKLMQLLIMIRVYLKYDLNRLNNCKCSKM